MGVLPGKTNIVHYLTYLKIGGSCSQSRAELTATSLRNGDKRSLN